MKRAEAPAPGWYPDPVQRARLRWWDGSDWSDHRRVGPRPADLSAGADSPSDQPATRRSWSTAATPAPSAAAAGGRAAATAGSAGQAASGISRQDASAIVNEVRRATRGELERATTRLAAQAGGLREQLEPLLRDYGRRLARWARRAAFFAVVLYVLYAIASAQLQVSLLDWLGERVDDLFG